jgi:hypothetical protein
MVSAGSEPEAIEARSGKVPPALPETFQTERQGFQHHPHQVYTIMEVDGGAFQSETPQSLLNKELPPTSNGSLPDGGRSGKTRLHTQGKDSLPQLF